MRRAIYKYFYTFVVVCHINILGVMHNQLFLFCFYLHKMQVLTRLSLYNLPQKKTGAGLHSGCVVLRHQARAHHPQWFLPYDNERQEGGAGCGQGHRVRLCAQLPGAVHPQQGDQARGEILQGMYSIFCTEDRRLRKGKSGRAPIMHSYLPSLPSFPRFPL